MDRFTKFLVGIVAFAMTAQVSAGVVRDDKGDTDWEFILTPYLWAISLNGTNQVGPFPPTDIDASFGDIFDNLNMALAAHMELHRGKWAIALDPMWAQLEMDMGEPVMSGLDAKVLPAAAQPSQCSTRRTRTAHDL